MVEGRKPLLPVPVPGRYYARNGEVLLCIAVREGLDRYYWFIDAETTPVIVLAEADLAVNLVAEVAFPL